MSRMHSQSGFAALAGYEHSPSRAAFTSLVAVLHAIATARGQPTLLSPAELTAYGAVLASHRTADRMAFAGTGRAACWCGCEHLAAAAAAAACCIWWLSC